MDISKKRKKERREEIKKEGKKERKKDKKKKKKRNISKKKQSTEFKRLNKLKCPSEDASVPLEKRRKQS